MEEGSSPEKIDATETPSRTLNTAIMHNEGHMKVNDNLHKSKVSNVVKTVHQSIRRTSNNDKGFTGKSFQNYSSSRKAIIKASAVILLYLISGTTVFGLWMEDWNAIDAAYFTVATFTTVGYGDLHPETRGQRIFGIFFVTIGIMVIGGVVLGILMDSL